MEINQLIKTANPSRFGMPACGHAMPMTSALVAKAVVTGDMGFAVPAYFRGSHAWRPPTS